MSDPKAEKATKKKARVLIAFVHADEQRQPNDVITVTADEEASLAGLIDTAPAAVKYAESLEG
jgi:hypothetical protein